MYGFRVQASGADSPGLNPSSPLTSCENWGAFLSPCLIFLFCEKGMMVAVSSVSFLIHIYAHGLIQSLKYPCKVGSRKCTPPGGACGDEAYDEPMPTSGAAARPTSSRCPTSQYFFQPSAELLTHRHTTVAQWLRQRPPYILTHGLWLPLITGGLPGTPG